MPGAPQTRLGPPRRTRSTPRTNRRPPLQPTESLRSIRRRQALPKDNAHRAEIERSGAYVHSGPSVDAAVISVLPVGKQLRILAYKDGWVQLQDTGGQPSLETRDDWARPAWREGNPSFADMYLRRFYRGY